MSTSYTIGDAFKSFYEDVVTLKATTKEFVALRDKKQLTPSFIEAYTNFLNATNDSKYQLITLASPEIRLEISKATGQNYNLVAAQIDGMYLDIGKMLAGEKLTFGGFDGLDDLGEPITLIVIGVIAICAAIATWKALDYLEASKKIEAILKISEDRREAMLGLMETCKANKYSSKECNALAQEINDGFDQDSDALKSPVLLDTLKSIGVYVAVGAVGLGVFYFFGPQIISTAKKVLFSARREIQA